MIFEKKGRAVYISHLDLLRTMQRALKRSKIPVWYTEGFNPKIYLNFPLALSVGVESCCEAMDFEIVSDVPCGELAERLNAALPEGIHIISCYYGVHSNKDIGFAEYELAFSANAHVGELFDGFMAQEKIEIQKHSKKKISVTVDIKPYTELLSKEQCGDLLKLCIRLPAGNDMNLNAAVFTDAFIRYGKEKGAEIVCNYAKRTKILCKSGEKFT